MARSSDELQSKRCGEFCDVDSLPRRRIPAHHPSFPQPLPLTIRPAAAKTAAAGPAAMHPAAMRSAAMRPAAMRPAAMRSAANPVAVGLVPALRFAAAAPLAAPPAPVEIRLRALAPAPKLLESFC